MATASLTGLLEPGIKCIFKQNLELNPPYCDNVKLLVMPDPMTDSIKCEAHYKEDYSHKEYAMGIRISRKMVEDDQYGAITHSIRNLAKAMSRAINKGGGMATSDYFREGTEFIRELDPLEVAVMEAVRELR